MPIQITIDQDATTCLNPLAEGEYKEAVERYAEELLKEASRLEAALNTTKGKPQITSSMVKDGDLLLRRGYARPKRKTSLVLAQLVSTVGGFVTGLFADPDKLKDATMLVVFVVLLTVTITTTVIVVVKE